MKDRSSRRPGGPDAASEEVREGQRRKETVRGVELYALRRIGSPLAHDLKNLAARLGFLADNLRDGANEPDVIEACATTVEDTKRRLDEVAQRFREGRQALVHPAPGAISRALDAALDATGARTAAGVELELSIEPIPESAIDAAALEQAFGDILRNALEAMRAGGRLTVTCRQVQGPGGRPGAEVAVTDEGPGMSAEFVERDLFAPFRSTKHDGLGLGMFACRELVELHRGSVEVDSGPGHGTTVRVSLPLEPEKGRPA